MLTVVGLLVLGYLVGSVPTGYWLVKAIKGIDIRTCGSGSTGATNVLRAAGRGAAGFVLFVDALKGYFPVWLAMSVESQGALANMPLSHLHLVPPAVAVCSLVGHSRSIFLGFQGGKSAATGLGTLCALQPYSAILSFGLWWVVVWLTRFVSLASIVACWVSGVLTLLFGSPLSYVGYCFIGAVYITLRHKLNIKRLLTGTETRIGEKTQE
ncbi:MAG: glycerol-3-phosphate 1-O-acyltransferase PlsY [Candidatus Melainabacteria bacterium]|nr:glycerol-3-phosphate 1-O-acyltransferase PlsY [Candidatus Melainabacteria bacterium]